MVTIINASAHDPYEITSTASLQASSMELRIEMEFRTALRLAGMNDESPPQAENDLFQLWQSRLMDAAGGFFQITAGDSLISAEATNVTLGVENHVQFQLKYPQTESRQLRFAAIGLKPFEGQSPYGTSLTVLDMVNKKVVGQVVLFPTSETSEFGPPAKSSDHSTQPVRIAARQLDQTSSLLPSTKQPVSPNGKTQLPRWLILVVAGAICAVVIARRSLRNVKTTLGCMAILTLAAPVSAQRQMEKLGRGVVVIRTSASSAYVGWRMLGTDPVETGFNLYRSANGGAALKLNASPITNSCNFSDATVSFSQTNAYFVRAIIGGIEGPPGAAFSLAPNIPILPYLNLPLSPPPDGVAWDGVPYSYNANDCSVGDVDGDGEYEIILKWDPSNSHDNSQSGFTGDTYLDCYKLNGTRLWRIDLGPNIRSGAHYTDFMVYDFDGDGKAEMMCRTAPGSQDGLGNYVGSLAKWQTSNGPHPTFNNTDDYRFNNPNPNTTNGYVLHGPEFITVFNGLTGEELATTTWYPKRDPDNDNDNPTASRINTVWGDSYGNRLDRFLAGIAFCDGIRPSAIFCRGYYTRAYVTAWDWRNGQLTKRWSFSSDPSNLTYRGQGAHSLSIGDADGDGKDEVLYGAASINDNGSGHYSTQLGHGDAEHFSDMDPLRPGLEVWMVHESPSSYGPNGLEFRDAKTGGLIFGVDGQNADVGRGVAYDIDPRYRGYEMWGSRGGLMSATGVQISSTRPGQMNFCVWWDADLLRETLDGTTISKWNWTSSSSGSILSPAGLLSNNGTKSTPCLSADILGDWREEVIWRTSDNLNLRIYSTTTLATNRIYTLMHDPQYRCAIAWQNTGYNQPPHSGFFIGQDMFPPPLAPTSSADLVWRGGGGNVWDSSALNWFTNGVWVGNNTAVAFSSGRSVLFDLSGSNNTALNLTGALSPSQVTVHSAKDFAFSGSGQLSGPMKLIKAGPARLTIGTTNIYSGATYVSGGTLFINGALDASPVIVERRGTPEGPSQFGGAGSLGAGLTVQAGCVVIIGPGTNSPGTLTVSNNVTELGVLNRFDLSNDPTASVKTNDMIQIYGNLTLSGTNTIEIRQLDGSLGGGVYPLFKYTGTLSGGLANLVLSGSFIQGVALTNPPGMIALAASIPGAPPAAPSGLVATAAGAFQINLSWTDNSGDENAFLIERSLNGLAFSPIAINPPNDTTYSDTGLSPSTTYYYRARGTNLAGASGFSNTNSATTTPPPTLLTWRGDGAGNIWDVAGALNWSDGANIVVYNNGADVVFDQSGSNNSAVMLTGALQPDSVTVNATKNYTFNSTNGFLGGPTALTKAGSGTLTINNSNSFSGGVNLNSGTLTLGNTFGAGSGPIRFNGGTVSFVVGNQQTYANAMVINSNSTILSQGGNNNIVSGTWGGSNTTLNIAISSTGTFTVGGNMTNFPGTVALNNSGGFFRFNGSAGGPNTTFDLGTGTSTLNNRNGVTVILGVLTGGSGTFLSGAGAVDSPSTYLVGSKNISTTFNGTIRNANSARIVNINKVGSGTWTLSNTNAYTGTTTVSAGTLLVNGNQSAATGNVTVGPAGTLGGTGVIGGNTTVNGTVAPGTSIGTLTFNGNLILSSSATSLFELSHSPLTNDVARVLGSVTFGGALNVLNIDPDLLEAGDSFQLFAATNFSGSFSSINLPVLEAGLLWVTNSLPVNGTLYVITDTNPPPPFISNVGATPQVTSVIITWDTLTESTSQVEYGFTTNYQNLTPLSSALTADHAVLLTGLTPDTSYYFRVISKTGTNVFRSASASFSTGGSLVVDNPAASFNGSWTLGTSSSDKYDASYQFTLANANPSPSAQATYTPNIPVAGLYDVSVWYPAGSNRTTNAQITVFYDGGAALRSVNQMTNGGAWQTLASNLNFIAGTSGFAVIANNTGETNAVVMADAMRWSYSLSQDHPTDGSVPTWWSDFYFGGAVDGSLDPDGDGYSNYAEYVHGTEPTNLLSHLDLRAQVAGGQIQFTFTPAVGGRTYQISVATNLSGLWTLLPDSAISTNGLGTIYISRPTTPGSWYYRLAVRLTP